jgi:hypothetical protein
MASSAIERTCVIVSFSFIQTDVARILAHEIYSILRRGILGRLSYMFTCIHPVEMSRPVARIRHGFHSGWQP